MFDNLFVFEAKNAKELLMNVDAQKIVRKDYDAYLFGDPEISMMLRFLLSNYWGKRVGVNAPEPIYGCHVLWSPGEMSSEQIDIKKCNDGFYPLYLSFVRDIVFWNSEFNMKMIRDELVEMLKPSSAASFSVVTAGL